MMKKKMKTMREAEEVKNPETRLSWMKLVMLPLLILGCNKNTANMPNPYCNTQGTVSMLKPSRKKE